MITAPSTAIELDHEPAARSVGSCRGHAEQRQQRERGHDRDILEQQDAECGAAKLGIELSALGEQLQRQRRGGHRQGKADDERRLPGLPENEVGGGADCRSWSTSTCAEPRPKMDLRSTHSREGCSSRPMTNIEQHDAELARYSGWHRRC